MEQASGHWLQACVTYWPTASCMQTSTWYTCQVISTRQSQIRLQATSGYLQTSWGAMRFQFSSQRYLSNIFQLYLLTIPYTDANRRTDLSPVKKINRAQKIPCCLLNVASILSVVFSIGLRPHIHNSDALSSQLRQAWRPKLRLYTSQASFTDSLSCRHRLWTVSLSLYCLLLRKSLRKNQLKYYKGSRSYQAFSGTNIFHNKKLSRNLLLVLRHKGMKSPSNHPYNSLKSNELKFVFNILITNWLTGENNSPSSLN